MQDWEMSIQRANIWTILISAMRDCLGEKACGRLSRCPPFEEVVRIMNPNNDKMYGWNLLNTMEPAIGIIEFRREAAALLPRTSSFISKF